MSSKSAKLTARGEDKRRYDFIFSAQRVELYDKMSRNLHHPRYRDDMIHHYDELTRINRKMYDLNYPCPPPAPKEVDTNLHATQSFHSSRFNSNDPKMRSKYMSSYRMKQKESAITLKKQIIKKASKGDYPDQNKIIAAVARTLLQSGCDQETVQYALQNVAVRYIVNKETAEIVISLHL